MTQPHIGILPLYIALYDELGLEPRRIQGEFTEQVAMMLRYEGLAVTVAPICCLRSETASAMAQLTAANVDLIVTLHLAYSPSLESVDILAAQPLPLLLLDITPDLDFGLDVDLDRLMYNHGIHGVQDMAAMLRRRERDFAIVAGHLSDHCVRQRVTAIARAAQATVALHRTRALRVGADFAGMGDFQVDPGVLKAKLGVDVQAIEVSALLPEIAQVTEEQIATEMAADRAAYRVEVDEAIHRHTLRLCLGLRRYLNSGNYQAFSMNFLAFTEQDGPLSVVPFLECSKAMARGIGYAGEGDVLTAALVGALQTGFGDTTFTEMFCPDWSGGTIFLSHMGEINPALAADTPVLFEKPYPFSAAQNPAALACALRPGKAILVNLSPGPRDTFRLILAPVEVLADGTHPSMQHSLRAWVRPAWPVEEFLETYSELGGTHHSALVYGEQLEGLTAFARFAGFECQVIG